MFHYPTNSKFALANVQYVWTKFSICIKRLGVIVYLLTFLFLGTVAGKSAH
jgi:hypothetical protein